MTAAMAVSATFAAATTASGYYTLSVTDAGSGSGTVTSSVGGIVCKAGTCTASLASGSTVTLSAAPASANAFAGWSGACSGSASTCTVLMAASESVTASFVPSSSTCVQSSSSTALASIISNGSGVLTTNTILNSTCPADTTWQAVNGKCYGSYAVQVNAYAAPPADTNFSMWSNSASCWGFNVAEPTNPNYTFWNSPLVTRGFSFGVNGLLTPAGGMLVANLNSLYAKTAEPCPISGSSGSVCAKWSMSVPGVAAQSAINTAARSDTKWDALLDIYFHATAKPSVQQNASFDLQIYQMVMDFSVGGTPNWATNIIGTHTIKTIGATSYLVSVNMGNPGTEGSNWVGNGGTYNSISMFPLPTYPSSTASGAAGSYLWGQASMVHDVGGIIAWLSQTQTINGVSGIFDDAGHLLYDNVRRVNVTSALLNPSFYLTGLNPGYEVITATPSSSYPNNTVFTTTDFWVALPGETIGN
jgi:Divergent InlB B-repeat domain